jgi:uncharacterized protein (TIGR02466 family)
MEQVTNQISVVNAHSPYMFKLHYEFEFDKIKPLCREIMDSAPSEFPLVSNGGSSHQNKKQAHKLPELKEYFDWLKVMIREIAIQGMGYSNTYHKYTISNSWFNVHYNGGKTHTHNHSNTFMVAAAYLHMPENGGYYMAKDPLESLKSFYYHDTPDWMWTEIPVVSGDIIVFPGWMQHKTQENKSNEERWVLTTNFDQQFNEDGNYFK